jgi:hypothetical protein
MMTFHGRHRPLEAYFLVLEKADFLVEALCEPSVPEHAIVSETNRRWQRIPFFLAPTHASPIKIRSPSGVGPL